MPDKYIKEICIVAGFPSDNNPKDSPLGKQEHIAEAAQCFNKKGFFIKPTNIMLVEDTKRNLVIAQKEQIYPVFVSDLPNPNPKTYVPEILKFVKKNVNTKVLKIRLPREMPSVDLILTALSHHTKVVWETRGKGREQLVSEVMTNHQAKALQSKIHPNLNPLIVETRNKEGFRVLIETDIAFKYQTDIMFNPPLAKNFPDMNALLYTIQPVVDFHVPKNNRFETNFLLVLLHNYNLVSGSVKQFESRSTGGKIIEYISEKYDNNLLGNIQIETDIKKLSELIQGFHIDVARAGGAFVPIDPTYPAERLSYLLEDSRVSILLTDRRSQRQLATLEGRTVLLDDLGKLPVPTRRPAFSASAEDPVYMIYTSGSTGMPKGVVVPHRGIVRLVRDQNYLGFGPDLVFHHHLSISFDACQLSIMSALLHGGTLVLSADEKPSLADIAGSVRKHGVNTLITSAGLFKLLVDEHMQDLKGLRHAAVSMNLSQMRGIRI